MIRMHIGFDDTDSPRMGCTTYIAALLVERLHKIGATFLDYPSLVRLNPNVPWKTRGNGALCLRVKSNEDLVEEIVETVIDTVEKHADLDDDGTDPGVVVLFQKIPTEVEAFAKRTIQNVVKMEEALKLVRIFKAEAVGFKKGRGIIGGLAAIGETLEEDHTYEIITYRTPENCGTPRKIQASSVKDMDEKTSPLTFNNVDPETGRILITPRGPDPILYGIRGETPEVVKEAHETIISQESIERWIIFRTNHGTDAHLRRASSISEVRPSNPVVVQGFVDMAPRVLPGGHVVFSIEDETGQIDCAAYEPTGALEKVAKQLIPKDYVEVCGGVRSASESHPNTINLEKILILKLAPKITFSNPKCPNCAKRMGSMGKGQGFRCERCGYRSAALGKVSVRSKRNLKKGLYITSPRSQRHLTKPQCRYGREKSGKPNKLIEGWHFP